MINAIRLSENKISGSTSTTQTSTAATTDVPSLDVELSQTTVLSCDICCEFVDLNSLCYPTAVINKLLSTVGITGWVCLACRVETKLKFTAEQQAMPVLKDAVDNIQYVIQMIKSVLQTTTQDATVRSDPGTWPSIADSTKDQVKFVAAVRADFENSLKHK